MQIKNIEEINTDNVLKWFANIGITKIVDIAKMINVSNSSLDTALKSVKGLTQWHKTAFYHYIECYELKKQVSQLQEQLQNSTRADNQTELLKDLNQFKEEINKRFEKLSSQTKKIDASQSNENNDLNSKDQYKIILDTLQKENDKRLQILTKTITENLTNEFKKEESKRFEILTKQTIENLTKELKKDIDKRFENLNNTSNIKEALKKENDKRFEILTKQTIENLTNELKKEESKRLKNEVLKQLENFTNTSTIKEALKKENDKRLIILKDELTTFIKKEVLKDDIKLSTETLNNFNDIQKKVNTLLKSPIIQGLIKDYE